MTDKTANQERPFEIGLFDFVDNGAFVAGTPRRSPAEIMANLLEIIELADQTGLDVFAIGEHHRQEYLASAPAVILGAAAARTSRIRLSSAVTVLSSDDPVRVFQTFATVDLLANGRAEIIAGRGSFIESFPLFGYDLNDYHKLFDEKLRLLVALRDRERITWSGEFRAPLEDRGVYPRPVQSQLPIWVAVGGTPESVMRAAALGLPMAVAIIGGQPSRFAPFFQLYRHAAAEAGHDPTTIPLSVNSHGFIADDEQAAVDLYYPAATAMMNKIGRERGWPPRAQAQLEQQRVLDGADFVGTPGQIIEKILHQHELFDHQRFLMYLGNSSVPHREMLRAVELLGTVVAPAVRKEVARRTAHAATNSPV